VDDVDQDHLPSPELRHSGFFIPRLRREDVELRHISIRLRSVSSEVCSKGVNLRVLSFEPMIIASILMMGLLHRLAPRTSVLAVMATLAVLAAAVSPRWRPEASSYAGVTLGAVTVGIILSAWGVYVYTEPENYLALGVTTVAGIGIVSSVDRLGESAARYLRLAIMVVLIGVVVMIGHIAINESQSPSFDTLLLHQSAAEEIAKGENPYITATAPNSYLYAPEGSVFEGYVYPPMTLAWFAGSDLLFGDSRWASVLAVGIFIALLLALSILAAASLSHHFLLV
jgi:hypothetical protein